MAHKMFTLTPVAVTSAGTRVSLTAGYPEKSTVVCGAASTLTSGDYFHLYLPDGTDYLVWYDIDDGGGGPTAGAGQVLAEVDIAAADTNAQVATKTKLVIDALAGFVATVATATVTITCASNGPTTNIADGSAATSFTFATLVEGRDAIDDRIVTAINVYAVDGNAGLIYIGDDQVSSTRYAAVLDAEESFDIKSDHPTMEFFLSDVYIDASVSTEKVQVSYIKRR